LAAASQATQDLSIFNPVSPPAESIRSLDRDLVVGYLRTLR
jgi:hypothetical protein